MHTLLLRLAGPMQSWGTQSRFSVRDTGMEPSKSGVIGLICAALGRDRSESVDDLGALKMGVRIDREGVMMCDYHTAQNVLKAGGGIKPTELSTRYFLADADFLVGLEGEDLGLLANTHNALLSPQWQLFLGRKSFPPASPVCVDSGPRKNAGLLDALRQTPFCPRHDDQRVNDGVVRLRFVLETDYGTGPEVRSDDPHADAFNSRQFGLRYVKTEYYEVPVCKEG